MSQSPLPSPIAQLKKCLLLTQEITTQGEASQAFEQLRQQVALEDPLAAELLELLWQEVLTARRSADFWQQMCDVEKQLSDRMMENMTQLRQSYLRLMQEM